MTCSARLPIYTVLIAAFIPDHRSLGGWIGLQGLVMLGLYILGIVLAVLAAWIFKRTVLRGPTPTFLMELPGYKWPQPLAMALRLWERGRLFVVRAGTVIFSVCVVVWALAYFPRPRQCTTGSRPNEARHKPASRGRRSILSWARVSRSGRAPAYLEQSLFGRMGHAIEPAFRPLGWDWRVAMAAIASFPVVTTRSLRFGSS